MNNSWLILYIYVVDAQWWPLIMSNVWALLAVPPAGMMVAAVLVINLGGVYNCVAYTVIRRRLQRQNTSRGQQVVLSRGDTVAVATGDRGSALTVTSSVSQHLEEKVGDEMGSSN
jgi:hypothetical protein